MGNIKKGSVRYFRNPDVVLREEDDDGGLLFNPDTNQIKVINPTGLFIWNMCNGSNDVNVIKKQLEESFEGVPADKASDEIDEFLKEMVSSGFIGVPEE